MPNIKSQKDRVVQAAAEQAHNKAIKTNLKTVVKKADAAIDANAADKDATVLAAVSAIDKARAKGVIKRTPPAARSAVWQSVLTRTLDRFLIDEQNLCTGFPAQGFLFCPLFRARQQAAQNRTGWQNRTPAPAPEAAPAAGRRAARPAAPTQPMPWAPPPQGPAPAAPVPGMYGTHCPAAGLPPRTRPVQPKAPTKGRPAVLHPHHLLFCTVYRSAVEKQGEGWRTK